jgi:ribosomal protein S18 acetylase RimI-like enzyme
MQVAIRPAGPEHLNEIAALAAIIWRAHYPGIIAHEQIDYMLARMYDVEVMRREIESGIAYDRLLVDGALRGFCSYGPTSNAGELKLHKLYIQPDWQRHGLGGSLLNHIAGVARKRDFSILILAVNKKNTHAIAAYRKHGFTIRESIVADIGGGFVMDDYVMAKLL